MQRALKRSRRLRARLFAACCGLLASGAGANPQGPNVAAGQASFANVGPKMLQITNSPGAVVNWSSFSIGADETTRFVQQTAASAVLNRVTGNTTSQLLGQLVSNGRVFLINPAGILVGRDATIDTAGLVLSTLNMRDDDFRQGILRFADGGAAGPITNHGYIKTAPGGETILIAPSITNAPEAGNEKSGLIENPDGRLLLAAGHTISITSLDHPDITFDVSAPDGEVVNLGSLVVKGGMAAVLAGTIKHGGMISADSVALDAAGHVVLTASKAVTTTAGSTIGARGTEGGAGGAVEIAARAPASGTTTAAATEMQLAGTVDVTGGQGGTAHVEADHVALTGTIDASGATAGGRIEVLGNDIATTGAKVAANAEHGPAGAVRVGGDFHGAAGTRTASTTTIDAASELHADALASGDGGSVVLWSEHTTEFRGLASARGGRAGGNGGQLEVSGKDSLGFRGTVDVGAPLGDAGSLLLDPARILIIPGGTSTELRDPTPFANDHFGSFNFFTVLSNGNLLMANQNAGNTGASGAGEVYLYDTNGNYLGGVAGTAQNEHLGNSLYDLYNGNIAVLDQNASNGGLANAGAVIVLSASTGAELGRTYGRSANELFGQTVVSPTTGNALWYHYYVPSENLLVLSPGADVGGASNAGAVVMVSALNGLKLSEITGDTANESLGSSLVYNIGAGHNFVIESSGHAAGAGAVILGNSTTGAEIGRVSGATAGDAFGANVSFNIGSAGNYLVRSTTATVGGQANAGTLVLVNAATGLEIGRTSGTTANEFFGSLADFNNAPNGNIVVPSPDEDVGGQAGAGTVVLVNVNTGTEIGRVSGNTASEGFGSVLQYGIGPNSDYVVQSAFEDVGGFTAAGTVVLVSSTTGLELGRVSGNTTNEQLGAAVDYFIGANGNYVIRSPDETVGPNASAGAVILASSTTGVELGRVSGGSAGARFGDNVDYSNVPFGTYLVRSPTSDVAGNLAAGTAVLVNDSAGTEIGRTNGLAAGDALGSYAPTLLASGNYVLRVPDATIGGNAVAGSVVLVDGTNGLRLTSYDGDTLNERLGLYDIDLDGFVTGSSVVDFSSLGFSDFLVYSPHHGGDAGVIAQLMDTPSVGNILRGSVAGGTSADLVGNEQVTFLPNGNYVIADTRYANTTSFLAGPVAGAGAVFVVDAATASPLATLLGNTNNEALGSNVDYSIFCCGNSFAVLSSTHGTTLSTGAGDLAGAVYFVDGSSGGIGTFIGTPGSQTGLVSLQLAAGGGVIVPSIFASPGAVSGAGTVYLLDSVTATVIGQVDGVSAGENLGSTSIDTSTLSNGNYLIMSPFRTVGGNANAGAVLQVDGSTGAQLGGVFGTSAGELLGQGSWIQPLFFGANGSAGNYLVMSHLANGVAGADAGAAILASGATGNEIGRLEGASVNEQLGTSGFTTVYERSNGNYFLTSLKAGPGGLANAGSMYLADGSTGTVIGRVDGTAAGETLGSSVNTFLVPGDDVFVFSQFHTTAGGANAGTMLQLAASDLGGGNIVRGRIDGQSANERLGASGAFGTASTLSYTNGLLVRSTLASPNGVSGAGTLYFYDLATSSLSGQIDGTGVSEALGTNFWVERANGNLFIPSRFASPGNVSGAGSLILATGRGATIGRLDGNHVGEALGSTVDYFSVPNTAFVRSYLHDNGAISAAGGLFTVADTDLGGGNILRGQLLGNAANENLGLYGASFSAGKLRIQSPNAANAGITNAGALILANSTTLAEIARVSGTGVNEHLGLYSPFPATGSNFFLQSPDATVGGVANAGSVLLVDGTTYAVIGRADGNTAGERFGTNFNRYYDGTKYNYFVSAPTEDVGSLTAAGAIVQIDPVTGLAVRRLTGISANEHFGASISQLGDGRLYAPSPNADVNGITAAGRVVLIDPNGGGGGTSLGSSTLFATNPSGDLIITNETIEAILDSGADLVLQANNDILLTLGADIEARRGTLTLQAGRSIVLGAPIDVPTLKLVAHESAANGVLTQYTGSGSGDVVVDTTRIAANVLSVSGQVVQVLASQDALAEPLIIDTSSPEFFVNYLASTARKAGGAAFFLGGDAFELTADSVVLQGGAATGAFAALAAAGEFKVTTKALAMTAGTGSNADAVLLGLGGLGDISYKTCSGCKDLLFDPFGDVKSQTGIYINALRSPAIEAILTMLGKDQDRDEDSDEKKKEKKKEEDKESKDCAK
ncbi:MAG: filamentous hemagglutinin N-terminal domain-containing protein [Gammaproteobacteria bacterium]|nr:filamentous hemagglutinin N-terminal domain-containing protein [Gammaproteobacteria bacterium]